MNFIKTLNLTLVTLTAMGSQALAGPAFGPIPVGPQAAGASQVLIQNPMALLRFRSMAKAGFELSSVEIKTLTITDDKIETEFSFYAMDSGGSDSIRGFGVWKAVQTLVLSQLGGSFVTYTHEMKLIPPPSGAQFLNDSPTLGSGGALVLAALFSLPRKILEFDLLARRGWSVHAVRATQIQEQEFKYTISATDIGTQSEAVGSGEWTIHEIVKSDGYSHSSRFIHKMHRK